MHPAKYTVNRIAVVLQRHAAKTYGRIVVSGVLCRNVIDIEAAIRAEYRNGARLTKEKGNLKGQVQSINW